MSEIGLTHIYICNANKTPSLLDNIRDVFQHLNSSIVT